MMFRNLAVLLALAAIASPLSVVLAQTRQATVPEFQLPDFTVSAARVEQLIGDVPAAVSSVPAAAVLQSSRQLSLDEVLQGVPGLFILNPYNFAQDTRIAIRGFGARADFGIRGIKLIVDGIPSTTPDGQGGVDGIDFGSMKSVEVIRGPASALYGAASGGVILIQSERGPMVPFVETRLSAGDDGFAKAQFKAGGQNGALNYALTASRLAFDGHRDHSRTENTKFNSKLEYAIDSSSSLTAIINMIDMPMQDDPGGLTLAEVEAERHQARGRNLLYNGGEEVKQEKLGLVYRKSFSDSHGIVVRHYYVWRDFSNRLPFQSGGQVAFKRTFTGGGFQYNYSGENFRLSTGLDLDRQDDARMNFDNLNGTRGPLVLDQGELVTALGFFVSGEYPIGNAVTVSAAIRRDEVNFDVDDQFLADGDDSGGLTFSETSQLLGMVWKLQPKLSVFANVATSFETPTTTEFDNPEGGGFNTSLKPQTATNFEVGTRGSTESLTIPIRWELALFHIDIQDSLVPYELEAYPDREFFRNAGASSRDGLELSATTVLAPGLEATLAYTFSDFRYDTFSTPSGDYSSNRIPGVPEHFGDLILNYRHASGFYLRWNTRWIGEMQANDTNSTQITGSAISDVGIGIDLDMGAWTVAPFLRLGNVFNEDYNANIRINAFGGRHYEPGPGRSVFAGMRVRYSFE